ncbi:unnamed protein product, partial [Coffea canephora]
MTGDEESGSPLSGHPNTNQLPAAATTQGQIHATTAAATNGDLVVTAQQDKEEPTTTTANTVPFLKLFSFADSTDIFLMIIGTIGAIGNGLSLPLMTVFFGELTDSFGQTQNIK